MPLWSDLAHAMLKKLGEKSSLPIIGAESSLRIADRFRREFGEGLLQSFVESQLRDSDFGPSKLHDDLIALPWSDIFTTNFDTLLERTVQSSSIRGYQVITDHRQLVGRRGPGLIKLHGSVQHPGSLTLSAEHFRRYPLDKAAFVNTVRQSMIEKVFLLIGYSGEDPNFLNWSGWIRDELGEAAHRVYLCGYFGASRSTGAIHNDPNIRVIDLATLPIASQWEQNKWSENELHQKALEWLLTELTKSRTASADSWPKGLSHNPNQEYVSSDTLHELSEPDPVAFADDLDAFRMRCRRNSLLKTHFVFLRRELEEWLNSIWGSEHSFPEEIRIAFGSEKSNLSDLDIRNSVIESVSIFFATISYSASALFNARDEYPGWPFVPVARLSRSALTDSVTHWLEMFSEILGTEETSNSNLERTLNPKRAKILAVKFVLSTLTKRIDDVSHPLPLTLIRTFCFFRELLHRAELLFLPIGQKREPVRAFLMELVGIDQDHSKLWTLSNLRFGYSGHVPPELDITNEIEPERCVLGIAFIGLSLLHDARDRFDQAQFEVIAKYLLEANDTFKAMDVSWRVEHARSVLSSCLLLKPEKTRERRSEPASALSLVRRAAVRAANSNREGCERDLREAKRHLENAGVDSGYTLKLNAEEATLMFALSEFENLRSGFPVQNQRRSADFKIRMETLVRDYNVGSDLQRLRYDHDKQIPEDVHWRFLLEIGRNPSFMVQDGHDDYARAARRFEQESRLINSAGVMIYIGASQTLMTNFKLAIADVDLLLLQPESSVIALTAYICTAIDNLTLEEDHGRKSTSVRRLDPYHFDRHSTVIAITCTLLERAIKLSESASVVTLLVAACKVCQKTNNSRKKIYMLIGNAISLLSAEECQLVVGELIKLPLLEDQSIQTGVRDPLLVLATSSVSDLVKAPDTPNFTDHVANLLGRSDKTPRTALVYTGTSTQRAAAARRLIALAQLNFLDDGQKNDLEAVLRSEAKNAYLDGHDTISFSEFEWLELALSRRANLLRKKQKKTKKGSNKRQPRDAKLSNWQKVIEQEEKQLMDGFESDLPRTFENRFSPVIDSPVVREFLADWPSKEFVWKLLNAVFGWAKAVSPRGDISDRLASANFVAKLIAVVLIPSLQRMNDSEVAETIPWGEDAQEQLWGLLYDLTRKKRLPFHEPLTQMLVSRKMSGSEELLADLYRNIRSQKLWLAKSSVDSVYKLCSLIQDRLSNSPPPTSEERKRLKELQNRSLDSVRSLLLEPEHPNVALAIDCYCRLYRRLSLGKDATETKTVSIYVSMLREAIDQNDMRPAEVSLVKRRLIEIEKLITA